MENTPTVTQEYGFYYLQLEAVFGSVVSHNCIRMPMAHLMLGLQHGDHLRVLGTLHLLQHGFPVSDGLAVLLLN